MVILGACSRGTTQPPQIKKTNTNSYKEVSLSLPESAKHVLATAKTKNGKIRIFAVDKNASHPKIFESKASGQSWQEVADLSQAFTDRSFHTSEMGTTEIVLTQDNRAVIAFLKPKENSENGYSQEIFIMDDKNQVTPLNQTITDRLDAEQLTIGGLINNQLIALDTKAGKTVSFNLQTAQVEKEKTTAPFISTTITQDKLYYQSSQTLEVVSAKDFEEETLTPSLKKVEAVMAQAKGKSSLILDDNTNYFVLTDMGLQEINQEGKESFLFSSKQTSLTDTGLVVTAILTAPKKQFLVFTASESGSKLVKLVPNKKKTKDKGKVFKVYSLYNDDYIKQLVLVYQKAHPELDVVHEFGIDEPTSAGTSKDQIPTSELIKLLNTKIANGDGPDVLMLDHLNVEAYKKQDLLVDLADIIKQQDKDKIWTTVLGAYQDGKKYYGIPNQVSLPTVMPDSGFNQALGSLSDVTAYVEKLAKIDSLPVYADLSGFEQFSTILYQIFLSQDKQLTRENIKSYYTTLKTLYNLVDTTSDEARRKKDKLEKLIELRAGAFGLGLGDELVAKESQLAVDFQSNPKGILQNESIGKLLGVDLSTINKGKAKYYVPLNTLGVLSTSKNQKIAKDFISFSLTKKGQKANTYSLFGIPLDKSMTKSDLKYWGRMKLGREDPFKKNVKVDNIGYSDAFYKKWDKKIKALNTPLFFNKLIVDFLYEDIDNILTDQISVDHATDNAFSKIDLYLKE